MLTYQEAQAFAQKPMTAKLLEELWDTHWHLCNCGRREDALHYIKHVLEAHQDKKTQGAIFKAASLNSKRNPFKPSKTEKDQLVSGQEYLVLYLLSAMYLTEHGGGVGGGWLSELGESVLAYLQNTPEDNWFPKDLWWEEE